jgi:magnesium chelatase subunit D
VSAAAFPFSAIVGHDDLRTALLINAVDPSVGGVLVRGEKGTAKSTAVRSLVRLLPEVEAISDCPYSCDPERPDPACPAGPHDGSAPQRRAVRLVELPVGASIDRVAGSLDVERALTRGVRDFEPGLLAAAHRGLLYVDEVNLLADHLVDLLLDAAALGVNHVERDGVSVQHDARFLLIGTMNPEEGDLRPQLLDRFGLSVEVRGSRDPTDRAEVVRRRLAFEADAAGFARRFESDDNAVRERIRAARAALGSIALPNAIVALIARACAKLEVDGMRGDIICAKAAMALAALEGADAVGEEHIRSVAPLALAHRRRRGPLEQPGLDPAELDDALAEPDGEPPEGEPPDGEPPKGGGGDGRPPRDGPAANGGAGAERETVARPAASTGARESGGEAQFDPGAPAPESTDGPLPGFRAPSLALPSSGRGSAGRRARGRAETGRHVSDRPHTAGAPIALLPTILAAAPHQRSRGRGRPGLALQRSDLRAPVLEGREGALLVFVVDASGSMAARHRMAAVKGAVLALLVDAYQRRDLVALIAARGEDAELVLPPTASVDLAADRLATLRAGGRTPLRAGLDRARALVRTEGLRDSGRCALVLLVTDGRANAGGGDPAAAARAGAQALALEGADLVVVDSEQGRLRLGLARALADAAGARVIELDALAPPARRAA